MGNLNNETNKQIKEINKSALGIEPGFDASKGKALPLDHEGLEWKNGKKVVKLIERRCFQVAHTVKTVSCTSYGG